MLFHLNYFSLFFRFCTLSFSSNTSSSSSLKCNISLYPIATIAIILEQPLLIIIVGGVYVFETLSVIIQVTSFKLTGKRVFKMAPVHHHFEKCGWSEVKIVTVFSLITAVLCLIGFLAL